MPSAHPVPSCLEPAGKGADYSVCEWFGWRWLLWSPRRSPSVFTGVCHDTAAPAAAYRLTDESLAARTCRMPSVTLGLICPGPQQSLGQRRGDPKPLQPWRQGWTKLRPLSVTFGKSLPSCFPKAPVAALSVEDTCILVCVFFLSLSLWLFIVHCGGSGTCLRT